MLETIVNKLIKDIQSGIDKCEDLYSATYNHLEVVALNYLFYKKDVEDVLSEAYCRVFKYVKSADTTRNCYGWMCRIVQRVAYEYNGSHKVTEEIDNISESALFCDIEDYVSEKSDLLAALQTLSSADQKLMYLRFWEDLTYEEIAKRLGLKKNAVYKRIKTVLKIIKKILNHKSNF